MSEILPSGPEVIQFNDETWRKIPEIHRVFKEVAADIEYHSRAVPSLERDRLKHVVFQHNKKDPGHYLFVCDLAQNTSYNIYDLAIDDSEDFARLYVINVIDRKTLRDDGQVNWHKTQIEAGMVIPNCKERQIMRRLIEDFYDKTMLGI